MSDPAWVANLILDIDFLDPPEPVRCIIIDTLSRNYGIGSENDDQAMRAFIAGLERLRDTFDCAVIVVHHTGHGTAERSRGHSSFYAALDFSFNVAADKKELGLIRMGRAKMKDHPYPRDMGYRLAPVVIGTDVDGEETTGVVAIESPIGPRTNGKRTSNPDVREELDLSTGVRAVALAALAGLIESDGSEPPDDAAELGAGTVADADDRGTLRTNWLRARKALADAGIALSTGDGKYAWITRDGAARVDEAREFARKAMSTPK